MDVVGVHPKSKCKKPTKRGKKGVKVVYISSPMKVKIGASEFRARVQELTGKDSDTTRYMDFIDGANTADQSSPETLDHSRVLNDPSIFPLDMINPSWNYESSTSSDSVFESFDEFLPSLEGSSFMGMLQSTNLFYESSPSFNGVVD